MACQNPAYHLWDHVFLYINTLALPNCRPIVPILLEWTIAEIAFGITPPTSTPAYTSGRSRVHTWKGACQNAKRGMGYIRGMYFPLFRSPSIWGPDVRCERNVRVRCRSSGAKRERSRIRRKEANQILLTPYIYENDWKQYIYSRLFGTLRPMTYRWLNHFIVRYIPLWMYCTHTGIKKFSNETYVEMYVPLGTRVRGVSLGRARSMLVERNAKVLWMGPRNGGRSTWWWSQRWVSRS